MQVMTSGTTLNLIYNGASVANLTIHEIDQPWFHAAFESTTDFAQIQPLFETELQLFHAGDMDEWESAYSAIDALALRLESADGTQTIDDFLLHIDGRAAWFRY